MSERLVFLDIDTQVDFMLPGGKLYVPQAEEIIPTLAKLMLWARGRRIRVISSADAHAVDDPSFAEWPPHCVVGTPGQRRIAETLFSDARVIENRQGAFKTPEWVSQIILETQDYSISTNVNFDVLLATLGQPGFVAFGVATEYCVLASVMALRKRNLPVALVVDAVRAITEEGGRKAVEEMTAAGVQLVTAAEVRGPDFQNTGR